MLLEVPDGGRRVGATYSLASSKLKVCLLCLAMGNKEGKIDSI